MAALRAAQTIKDLLTLGRQGRTAKENLDINQVVKSCWANGSLRFVGEGKARVDMLAELSSTPLCVRGLESQLARAVDNLIRNAVEAVAGNGDVVRSKVPAGSKKSASVVVKSAQVDLLAPRAGYEIIPAGRYATLSVSDDGCGIGPQEVGRVFEPFFTKKRVNETSGSGLGLAIVHGVVKEHEGFIDVVSAPGLGTTISLYLPLVDGPARTEKVLAAPRGKRAHPDSSTTSRSSCAPDGGCSRASATRSR